MVEQIINEIKHELESELTPKQLNKVTEVLSQKLLQVPEINAESTDEQDFLKLFISAKRVEGCSDKTLRYYESTIRNMLDELNKSARSISTEALRQYLDQYQQKGNVSKVTLDNVRRIHKVKAGKTVKETYSDESLELMRDQCDNARDLALIDLLSSTGIRVGELVKLNRADIDFEHRECVVFGKGEKERRVYFDARTKIHLQKYLDERTDDNEALFVTLQKPHDRLLISGVEIRLRKIGRELNLHKVHPHKFRRTLATVAIDKGMPIEQVQSLLGHQSIDTTLQYAMVNQANVKNSYRKFIG